jgi:TMEM175 potassium channel family protein
LHQLLRGLDTFLRVADADKLPDDESLEERAFDYARTVALSDGVFSIALTLLVLNISLPVLASGHHGELGSALLHRREQFTSYAVSFIVIALLWVRHHRFFRALETIDTRTVVLNLAYLGSIAFLPYPTRVLGVYGDDPASVVLYASTVAIVALLGGAMRVHAEHDGLFTTMGAHELAQRESWFVTPAIFLGSIPVAFVSTTAAQLCWLLLLLPRVRRLST